MRILSSIVLLLFLVSCAATPEQMTAYYQAIEKQNAALVALARDGDARITAARTQQTVGFTSAMIRAASTPERTDDVVIAFAFGYESARAMSYTLPDLKTPAAPVTDVDRVRAWTPVIGILTPLAYPLMYGWASSSTSGGDRYQATGNGRITIASQNPGSYNKSGGNQSISASNTPDNATCDNCGAGELDDGAVVNPVTGDGGEIPEDCTDYPDAFYGSGTWWINSSGTCSCESRAAGRC